MTCVPRAPPWCRAVCVGAAFGIILIFVSSSLNTEEPSPPAPPPLLTTSPITTSYPIWPTDPGTALTISGSETAGIGAEDAQNWEPAAASPAERGTNPASLADMQRITASEALKPNSANSNGTAGLIGGLVVAGSSSQTIVPEIIRQPSPMGTTEAHLIKEEELAVDAWPTGHWPPGQAAESAADVEARLMRAAHTNMRSGGLPKLHGPEAYTSCRVLLMSGDSNVRNIFSAVARSLEAAGHVRSFKYPTPQQITMPCNPKSPGERCEARWSDQTWIYGPASGGRCTAVLLFRMMTNQGALERAIAKPFDTVFCSALSSSKGQSSPERFAMFKTKPVCRRAASCTCTVCCTCTCTVAPSPAPHTTYMYGSLARGCPFCTALCAQVCRDALRFGLGPAALAMLPRTVALWWHGHGLWGLDAASAWYDPSTSAVDGTVFDCPARFVDDIASMRELERRRVPGVKQAAHEQTRVHAETRLIDLPH